MTTPSSTLPWRQTIPVDKLRPGKHNPREDPGDLDGLTKSIKKQGLKQPLLVTPAPGSDYFDIEDGWRRYLAMVDWVTEIQCVVVPPIPGENMPVRAIFTALVTDAHRKDLNQIERAQGFGRLQKDFGLSATEIASQVGLSVSTVTNSMMLLELDPKTQGLVADGKVSASEMQQMLRKHRARQRAKQGQKPMAPKWEPDWFTGKHPLAQAAGDLCDRRDHTMRRRIGKVACGQCWESVIRRDEDLVVEAPDARVAVS